MCWGAILHDAGSQMRCEKLHVTFEGEAVATIKKDQSKRTVHTRRHLIL